MAVRITGAGVALTVGIIVVTGLIIGGFFWARESGEQARRDEAVQIAEENLEEQSGDDVALNEGENTNEENASNGENRNENDENTNEEGASNGSGQDIPSTGAEVPEEQAVEELPQTGPAETFGSILAVGGLTFAAVAYLISRQKLRDSL